jgi:hypothetical protein
MIKIPELTLGPRASTQDLSIASGEITNRLNQVIRALNGIQLEVPSAGQEGPQGPPGVAGSPGAPGIPGPEGPTRAPLAATFTTASLASLATEYGSVMLAKGSELYSITVDRASWVRFYLTAAAALADSGRTLGTPATPASGISAEFSFASSGTLLCDPVPFVRNWDLVRNAAIYYSVVNRSGSAGTVQVDLTYLPIEV